MKLVANEALKFQAAALILLVWLFAFCHMKGLTSQVCKIGRIKGLDLTCTFALQERKHWVELAALSGQEFSWKKKCKQYVCKHAAAILGVVMSTGN